MAQCRELLRRLASALPSVRPELVVVATAGDRGPSTDFTGALEEALGDGRIDWAVHSAKDLPSRLPPRLVLAGVPSRADPHDVLVARPGIDPRDPPPGACVGSSSLRRTAQILRWRPDLRVRPVRGNVGTRLRRLDAGAYDLLVLAAAGLQRLGESRRIGRRLPFARFLPAPGQGTLAIEARRGDARARRLARAVDDPASHACLLAERGVVEALGAGCNLPLGAMARERAGRLDLRAEALNARGTRSVAVRRAGSCSEALAIGRAAGRALVALGAESWIAEARRSTSRSSAPGRSSSSPFPNPSAQR